MKTCGKCRRYDPVGEICYVNFFGHLDHKTLACKDFRRKERYVYCKYCGAKLKRDAIGPYCPTENCQWQHGFDEDVE